MKKFILIWSVAFLLLLSPAYASIFGLNTTFINSPATGTSGYNATGGPLPRDSNNEPVGAIRASFANTSAWCTVDAGTGVIEKSAEEVNLTTGDSSVVLYWCGGDAIKDGLVLDFQYRAYDWTPGQANNFMGGFDTDLSLHSGDDGPVIEHINGLCSNTFFLGMVDGNTRTCSNPADTPRDIWQNITIAANATGVDGTLYMNNSDETKITVGTGALTPGSVVAFIFMGPAVHKFGIRSVSVYEGRTGAPQSAALPPPSIINNTLPSINITFPVNGSSLDNSTLFPIKINGTVTVQNGSISTLTINSTIFKNRGNQTLFNFTYNGTTEITNQRYDLLLNATSQYGNFTTAIISFTVDREGPSITATTLSGNHSLFYLYQNITFQINYSDNIKLFHINISTGSYSFEITNINQTSYIYNGSVNASTFGIGRQDLNTSFCDAHTSNRIDEWKTKRTDAKKEIRFDFGGDYFLVKPKDATLINSYVETKKEDRYIFSYTKNPFNKQNKQSFVVSSSQKIEIIGNDGGYYA